jgi:general secretion pathway protein H
MAPIRPSETGNEAGFTLTELLVVLAIIGLLIVATPILMQSALPGARSAAAARLLASDLRSVRAAAIARGLQTQLVFDASGRDYVSEPWHRVRTLPPGVLLGFGRTNSDGVSRSITFYPDGSSSGGRVLVGTGRSRHQVSTDWLTGRVAVDE